MPNTIPWSEDEEEEVRFTTTPALIATTPRRSGRLRQPQNNGYNLRSRVIIWQVEDDEDDDDASWYPEEHMADDDEDISLSSFEQDHAFHYTGLKKQIRGGAGKRFLWWLILGLIYWLLFTYYRNGYNADSFEAVSALWKKLQDQSTEFFSETKFWDAWVKNMTEDTVASKTTKKRFQAFRAVKTIWRRGPRDQVGMASRRNKGKVEEQSSWASLEQQLSLAIPNMLEWIREYQAGDAQDTVLTNNGWIYSRGRARRPTRNAMVWVRLADMPEARVTSIKDNQSIVMHIMDKAIARSSPKFLRPFKKGGKVNVVVDASDYAWGRIPGDAYQLSYLLPTLEKHYPGKFGSIYLCNTNAASRVLANLALTMQLQPPLSFTQQGTSPDHGAPKTDTPALYVLSNDPVTMLAQLQAVVPLSSIPKRLGGKDSYKFKPRRYPGRMGKEDAAGDLLGKLATRGSYLN